MLPQSINHESDTFFNACATEQKDDCPGGVVKCQAESKDGMINEAKQ